jgi:hypothetical protein
MQPVHMHRSNLWNHTNGRNEFVIVWDIFLIPTYSLNANCLRKCSL